MSENIQHKQTTQSRWHNGLAKRLIIVAVIVGIVAAIIMLIEYVTTPRVHFALKKFDCSAAAIEARNKLSGKTDEDACVVDLTIKAGGSRYYIA